MIPFPRRLWQAVLLTAVLGIAACGIKPAAVDPPPSDEPDRFPRTYPTS